MRELLLTTHHWLAFIALALLVWATINGISGYSGNKPFTPNHKKTNLFALISVHTMVLIGIYLLYTAMKSADAGSLMKDALARKTYVEHPTMNIFAAILVTVGNALSKKGKTDVKKFRVTFWFFGLALVLILSRLPFEKLF